MISRFIKTKNPDILPQNTSNCYIESINSLHRCVCLALLQLLVSMRCLLYEGGIDTLLQFLCWNVIVLAYCKV